MYLLAQLVEHPGRDGCGVSPQQVLLGLLKLPVVLVASGAIAASLVGSLHSLQILHWKLVGVHGVCSG